MEDRRCLYCNKPVYGRSDKKFSSDVCRNSFHNQRNAPRYHYMRTINATLVKNRKILEALHLAGKKKEHKDKLLKQGFDFGFYTHVANQAKGDIQRFCYDHGYQLEEDHVLIIKSDSETA